jgi:TetR/AcrR family transcriptional repressor of uid operon
MIQLYEQRFSVRVTEEHVEARKNQILDAAWECFAELGYHQTTMAAIAAAAGLSTGAIYLYFENKDALMSAINERSREMNRRVVAEARAATKDPLTALNTVGRAMLAIFSDARFEEATRVNIEIWPEIVRSGRLTANLREDLAFWKEAVDGLLREAQAAGELQSDVDTTALTLLLISAWEGLRHYRLVDEDFTQTVLLDAMRPIVTAKGMLALEGAVASSLEGSPVPPVGIPVAMPARVED